MESLALPFRHDLAAHQRSSKWRRAIRAFLRNARRSYGMGPMHDLPPSLEESILEAGKALDIGNCKSSTVMTRRAGGNILREI